MSKKRGSRYSEERKRAKRRVISYEDEPIEDYIEEKKSIPKLFRTFLKILVVLLASFAFVFIAINWETFSPDNIIDWFKYDVFNYGGGNGYPVSIAGTSIEAGNVKLIDKRLAYTSDTSLIVLNSQGGEIQNTQHNYTKPYLETNGNKGILYNLGGTGYTIVSKSEAIHSDNLSSNIISADIAENGTYAIISEAEGYLSKLTAFLANNTEMYKYSFSEYYINDISISSDGKKSVVCGISAKNGTICSVIYLIDFSKEAPVSVYEFNDTIIYDLSYLNNGNIAFVSSSSAGVINIETSNIKEYDYNDRDLTAYYLDRNYGVVVSVSTSSDGRNCSIVSIDNNCIFSEKVEVEEKVRSLSLNNNIFVLLSTGEVVIYSLYGENLGSCEIGNDTSKIISISDTEVYAVCINKIYKQIII